MSNAPSVTANISGIGHVDFVNPYTKKLVTIELTSFQEIYNSDDEQIFRFNSHNFSMITGIKDYMQVSIDTNAGEMYFSLYIGHIVEALFGSKKAEKPKDIKEYSYFVVQLRTTYTSEYQTRLFANFDSAYDFFLQSKSEMIDDARGFGWYEVTTDEEYNICINYDDRVQEITLEGLELSDTDAGLKRSFFQS